MKWFKVRKSENLTLYCGPSAICGITGFGGARVINEVHRVRGELKRNKKNRKKVVGMYTGEVLAVLANLGFRANIYFSPKGIGLGDWMTVSRKFHRQPDHLFLVVVTGHFILVRGSEIQCNQTGGRPICRSRAPGLRRVVHEVYRITKR